MREQPKSITPELIRFMKIANAAVQMNEENYLKMKAEILHQARGTEEGARHWIKEFFSHVDAARNNRKA